MVTGGSGIDVTGSGTAADPYVVDSTSRAITGTIQVSDTATVDLTLDGSGSVTDPYDLSARASVSVGDLEDVATGSPAAGDTLLWDGEGWIYGPPSSGGGGATVVTGSGIGGDGSVTTPVVLATSGVWGEAPLDRYGANTLLGAPIYVDSAGQARSQPMGVQVLTAGQSRPAQYPGRIIIEDGAPLYSTGSQWLPLQSPELVFDGDTIVGAGTDADPLEAKLPYSGVIDVPSPGVHVSGTRTLAFPLGMFSNPPAVVTNAHTAAPDNVHTSAINPSQASVIIVVRRADSLGNTPVNVFAAERRFDID